MNRLQTVNILKATTQVIQEREAAARSRHDELVLQFGIELEKMSRRRHKALRDRLAALEARIALLETRS